MSSRHFKNQYSTGNCHPTDLNSHDIIHRSYDILVNCTKNQPPINDNHDGGLYVGFLGHAYSLLRLSMSPKLSNQRKQMLENAKYIVDQDLLLHSQNKGMGNDTKLSFLLGRLGSLVMASCVYDQLNLEDEAKKFIRDITKIGEEFLNLNIMKSGSDEIFVGRSGYVAALSCLKLFVKNTNLDYPKDLLHNILNTIVQSGQQYSQKHNSKCPLMYAYYNTEYLGAGHGIVGILMALMCSREYLQENSVVTSMIQECINFLITNTGKDGNLAPSVDELKSSRSEDDQLVHWCHGAAGVIYVYARAYVLWKDKKYLDAALICGEVVWKYGLLKKGPGICHGVAGSGYVFLLLYRLTNDTSQLHRARCFYEFLWSNEFKAAARTPDTPYSLFEGWAGTACFMADLAHPDKAHFPFFDVFD